MTSISLGGSGRCPWRLHAEPREPGIGSLSDGAKERGEMATRSLQVQTDADQRVGQERPFVRRNLEKFDVTKELITQKSQNSMQHLVEGKDPRSQMKRKGNNRGIIEE